MNRQPIKNYEIIFNLSTAKGLNKKIKFIGTKEEARSHASHYIFNHRLLPQETYIRELR